VSALIAQGPPSRVLEEAIDGRIELILPDIVRDELERVLSAKLGFDTERIRAARQLLEGLAADRPGRPSVIESMTGDPADDIVLAAAIEAHADILVSGDRRHLLPIREHLGVRIVTPQALLAELREPRR
jgi:predicted nucleic acid-binding protein